MSEEIKAGDWVKEKSNPNSGVFKVLEINNDTLKIETSLAPCKLDINKLKKVYVYDEPKRKKNISQVQNPCDDWRPRDITYRIEEIIPGKKTVTGARLFKPLEDYTHEECVMKAIEYGWHNLSKENRELKSKLSEDIPQITQTEVKIKGGHMAGYGVEKAKVVKIIPRTQYENGMVLYSSGALFEKTYQQGWTKVELPHEQEDLKHLFE